MNDLWKEHQLEHHISELEKLDEYRKDSAQKRDDGIKTIKEIFDIIEDKKKNVDILEQVTMLETLWDNLKYIKKNEDRKEVRKNILEQVEKLKAQLTIELIYQHPFSVVLAARVMILFTNIPGLTFSQPVLRCWYCIFREIYTADRPDWSVGGARAADPGTVSAYTTFDCLSALLSFAKSHASTGKFYGKLAKLKKQLDKLENVPSGLEDWKKSEKEQISNAALAELNQLWQNFAVPGLEEPPEKEDNIKDYIKSTHDNFENNLKFVKDIYVRTKHELENYRTEEALTVQIQKIKSIDEKDDNYRKKINKFYRSESAHSMALSAFEEAIKGTDELGKLYQDQKNNNVQDQRKNNVDKWNLISDKLEHFSTRLTTVLHTPVRVFLESAITSQLAVPSEEILEWEPRELICAALSYSYLIEDPSEENRYLPRSIGKLLTIISNTGSFSIGKPTHVIDDFLLWPENIALISLFAKLLERAKYPIEPKLAQSLLKYIDTTRADQPYDGCQRKGWCSIYALEPRATQLLPTFYTVKALASINMMLDQQINNIILEHFTVKQPEDLQKEPGLYLDSLFYPDYGFQHRAPEELRRKSVASILHKMRLHVSNSELKSKDTIHSLVLFGPAGTGKTTLVESLALTCNVPLVTVTPSDLVKSGEGNIERRARTVFKALSLLTRVVILFDEFDPVLRRRDSEGRDTLNVFTFLTPGMLPKLKDLYQQAKRRSVAYLLITNRIGSLDEAAIRKGRFDEKVGIYPPDLLSRYGRFISQAQLYHKDLNHKALDLSNEQEQRIKDEQEQRIKEVLKATSGSGMQTLGRLFTNSDPKDKDTPFYYVSHLNEIDVNEIDDNDWSISDIESQLEKEDEIDLRGTAKIAQTEFLEWYWTEVWDKELDEKSLSLTDAIQKTVSYDQLEEKLKKKMKEKKKRQKKLNKKF